MLIFTDFCLALLKRLQKIREKWLADFCHLIEKYSVEFNKIWDLAIDPQLADSLLRFFFLSLKMMKIIEKSENMLNIRIFNRHDVLNTNFMKNPIIHLFQSHCTYNLSIIALQNTKKETYIEIFEFIFFSFFFNCFLSLITSM